eukprot:COSAG05_NODE_881_length_6789_cov_21.387743_6_plen_124_part_00
MSFLIFRCDDLWSLGVLEVLQSVCELEVLYLLVVICAHMHGCKHAVLCQESARALEQAAAAAAAKAELSARAQAAEAELAKVPRRLHDYRVKVLLLFHHGHMTGIFRTFIIPGLFPGNYFESW